MTKGKTRVAAAALTVAPILLAACAGGQMRLRGRARLPMDGDRKLAAELTVRAGRIVWDLNCLAAPPWNRDADPGRH